jgi:hypothetical protein
MASFQIPGKRRPGVMRSAAFCALPIVIALGASACGVTKPAGKTEVAVEPKMDEGDAALRGELEEPPRPLHQPIPLWKDGKIAGEIDAAAPGPGQIVLDLGENWVPYIFTERSLPTDERTPQSYRPTYLALARGEYPHDIHGARAKRDRYLEVFGILPTLGLVRDRFRETQKQDCLSKVDLEPLKGYERIVPYIDMAKARRDSSTFLAIERRVKQLLSKQSVDSVDKLETSKLSGGDKAVLKQYEKFGSTALVLRAAQARLQCEGFFQGRGVFLDGALDWSTNEALAAFEKKHRVFGWGFLSRDTVEALKEPPMLGERTAVLRVLTERAMHMAGFLEDGSTSLGPDKPRMYKGPDGKERAVPNLEKELREAIIKAFALDTPESTLAWLESLGKLPGEKLVAFEGPKTPEYYSPNMDLSAVIDRGDVWYEFPYDEKGRERPQPAHRRPMLTFFTEYQGEKIPLARFGTTIGGWRSEMVDGVEMWKYKNSPVGERVWRQIVTAPVWLPPAGTTARTLLTRDPKKPDTFIVNLHETGPSYASAYGLVAAYHSKFRANEEGEVELQGDEGIRTHGSVDYMSIMQRHSHGCHRLHNHIAVRLMSFALRHRPHKRLGERFVGYKNTVEQDGEEYEVKLDKTGYTFQLERPIPVEVLKGRIVGRQKTPITAAIPKYDSNAGAYMTPDGGAITVDRSGTMREVPAPIPVDPDAGAPLIPMEGVISPPESEHH